MDNLVNYIKNHGNDEHELSDESEEEVDDRWTCPACTFYN
jgi:rubredoxin